MAQNPFPFGSSKYDDWNYTHGVQDSTDQLLADSKGTLARSGRFLDSVTPEAETVAPEQNGFLNDTSESVLDSPWTKLARLGKQIVRPIPQALEGAAGVGSFLPGPVGAASRAVLGAESGANLLSGGTERLTEHPFASALDVGGLLAGASGVRGLKSLVTGADEMLPMADMLGGRALAYEGGAGARPANRPAVSALSKLMQSSSFENLPRGEVSMAKKAGQAATEWEGTRVPTYHAQDVLEQPGSQEYMASQFNKNKGVADEVFGKNKDLMGRSRGATEANLGPATDDLAKRYGRKPLDPMDRLAARSAERFGKRFRRE